ncbi:DUF2971 domain-containing protein [Acinetobacter johnsonii]|uniref:DUF2971 domain-containing protein n=2 Tax=Acinetobacter johnsonii TaxID=40214 RepID=A0AAV3WFU9_ACIJO|nr:DUF2971 domain-containing protein [Acinetobacter johnsonii]GEK44421.1 hypothetical protein AJO04nite_16790 [Acinetobacter johnsonii]
MLNHYNLSHDQIKRYSEAPQDKDYYYFYKYIYFNGDLNVLNIFSNNTLSFKHPTKFNDPFDCHFALDIDYSKFDVHVFNRLTKKSISQTQFRQKKQHFLKHLKTVFDPESFRNSYRNNMGVTCFTTTPLNILMWSHYTDSHKGFLLEFKFPKNDKANPPPIPILYEDSYPVLKLKVETMHDFHNKDFITKLLNKVYLTKASEWKYENEFRMLLPGEGFHKFNPKLLSSVIFGVSTPPNDKKLILNSLKEFNEKNNMSVQSFNAEISKQEYKLTVKKHPRIF